MSLDYLNQLLAIREMLNCPNADTVEEAYDLLYQLWLEQKENLEFGLDFKLIIGNSSISFLDFEARYKKESKKETVPNEKAQSKEDFGTVSALKNTIFISYSHNDHEWLNRFTKHLKVLCRKKTIDVWDDTKISTGAIWRDEINKALGTANAALLLVTPDFLASDFIMDNELPHIFDSAKKNGLAIFWVAVKPSLYEETYLVNFQAANNPKRPLIGLSEAEIECEIVEICKKIKAVIGWGII